MSVYIHMYHKYANLLYLEHTTYHPLRSHNAANTP